MINDGKNSLDKIVVATGNSHKLFEMNKLFEEFNVTFESLKSYPDFIAAEEDGNTFEINAVKKATKAAIELGEYCLADDSGLEVDAMDGRPGILSARYADTNDERISKLLGELEGVPFEKRTARFVCVMVIADPKGFAITRTGYCNGVINESASGSGGFGYDPVFFLPDRNCTMAELTDEQKNEISHRGLAAKEIKPVFEKLINGSTISELIDNYKKVIQ